ncbi:hypothetical protein [Qipengyuania sp. SM2507]
MPRPRTPPWSKQEIAALREFYPRQGIECVEHLPGRSWRAIHQKAFKLGIACEKSTGAPKPKLQGNELKEAIRLREDKDWSFARIGAKFGVAESSACNAVLIALCPRKGFTPAERDENGRITAAGLERLRYALKKGLKGVDIQLRLGVSASCVAEQRRRYQRELKDRGKAPLPLPGGGAAYSGTKLTRAQTKAVEDLFLEGFGTLKVAERTGASKTSCTRIRGRLVRRLKRQGKTLPGCDESGTRHEQKESSRFVTPEQRQALRDMLLSGVPVARAARQLVIGACTAYLMRNQLAAELEARGASLPTPDRNLSRRGSAARDRTWPPTGAKEIYAFRALLRESPFDEAKAQWRREKRDAIAAENQRPRTFEEQLARVRRGEIGIARTMARPHLEPIQSGARA